ncbi:MAG: PTS glucose/sucrose transporter subunit IIB [Collinsella sp.]|nr:PTS glucose/sucrose transporter subunit IIB [Collinsella sp.]
MKRDWNAMAQGILDAVGGPENISGMTHCATRLRLNLKDDAACDDAAVKEVEGVVNTLNKAGQYQVLIGTEVPKLYEKFEPLVKGSGVEISAATKDEGESIVS